MLVRIEHVTGAMLASGSFKLNAKLAPKPVTLDPVMPIMIEC